MSTDKKDKNPFKNMSAKTSQRLPPLDMARFLAIIMMIQGHTIYALASPEAVNINEFPWNAWHYLRGFTAPIFLMVSGAVHVFANKRGSSGRLSKKTIKRRIRIALILIGIGYILGFPAEKIYDIFFIEPQIWAKFFEVNILQLFGFSLLSLLAVYLLTRKDRSLGIASLIIALMITFATPFIDSIDWFAILPHPLAAYLSQKHGSIFTIFPFASYLFYGTALGTALKNIEQPRRTAFLLKYGIPIGIVFSALGFLLMELFQVHTYTYYKITDVNLGLTFVRAGVVMASLSVISLIYLKTKKLTKYYTIFGKRALFIYVAHLILLYGSALFPGINTLYHKSLSAVTAIFIAVLIVILTLLIVYYYEYSVNNYPKAKIFYRYLIAAYVIYVLFI